LLGADKKAEVIISILAKNVGVYQGKRPKMLGCTRGKGTKVPGKRGEKGQKCWGVPVEKEKGKSKRLKWI